MTPAMLRVLAQIEGRSDAGWYLRYAMRWYWTRGATSVPAKGMSMNTIGALIRRGHLRPERIDHWQGTAYHLDEKQVVSARAPQKEDGQHE